MLIRRFDENPLIRIEDVKPSRDDATVFGVFNCGAVRYNGEVLLLLRIAEKPIPTPGFQSTFLYDHEAGAVIVHRCKGENKEDLNNNGYWCLPYISHMRIARSADGVHFDLDTKESIPYFTRYDQSGMEDPRITPIDGRYYINYSAISQWGVNTMMLSTADFATYENHGVIFYHDNKDVAIFPEKVNGRYVALHRPSNKIMGPSMWIAYSPDLLHWGGYEFLAAPRRGKWDAQRVGCGSPPIRTERGWLAITHAANDDGHYCLGAMLLDLENPSKVLAYSDEPIMRPEKDYEFEGYLPDVIFQCGHIMDGDDRIILYYGACDDKVCAAETSVSGILKALGL